MMMFDDFQMLMVVVVDDVVDYDVGYRWGQIVNRHDVYYVAQDYYEKYKLERELLNLG